MTPPPIEVVAHDLQQQAATQGPIRLELSPFIAFCIIGQIQLASRHPANMGDSLEQACQFAANLTEHLPESAQQVIALGWSPENDE